MVRIPVETQSTRRWRKEDLLDLSRLFYDEKGIEAFAKRDLLTRRRVIAAHWDNAAPSYRTTWERLHEIEEARESALRARLASVPRKGLTLIRRLDAAQSVSPLMTLIEGLGQELPGNPAFGPFDVDAFINVDDELSPMAILEFFPRGDSQVPSTAFGSRLHFEMPLATTEARGPDGIIGQLGFLIFSERLNAGEDISLVGGQWLAHRGLWEVRRLDIIGALLNECAFAYIESQSGGSRRMVDAMTESTFDGTSIDGSVRTTRTRPGRD